MNCDIAVFFKPAGCSFLAFWTVLKSSPRSFTFLQAFASFWLFRKQAVIGTQTVFFLNLKFTCLWLTVHWPILNCYFCVFCSKCNLQSSGFHRTSSSIQYWSIAVFAHYFAILWYFLNLFCFVVFRTPLSPPPPPSLANVPQWISPVLIIAMNNVSFQASAAVKLNNGALMPSIALG